MRPSSAGEAEAGERTSRSLNLSTGGITLLGVLLSIGVTVGMGLTTAWWVRVVAGLATTAVLTLIVKLGSNAGRGPVARLAEWMIGSERGQR